MRCLFVHLFNGHLKTVQHTNDIKDKKIVGCAEGQVTVKWRITMSGRKHTATVIEIFKE